MRKLLMLIIMILIIASVSFAAEFSDLNEKFPAYIKAINSLSEKGVISGYPDGTFAPAYTVKRSEIAKILVTAFKLQRKELKNKLKDIDNSWSKDFVEIAVSNDVITGYEDGTFLPENTLTYGELAALVSKSLKLDIQTESGESWYNSYWRALSEAGLFDDVATNDLVPTNNARRDNVALIIFNALSYADKEKEDKKEPNKEENAENKEEKQENKKETADETVDSTKIYFGRVDTKQITRGRDTVDIDNYNADDMTLNVKNAKSIPENGSVLFYKIRKSLSVTHLKEVKIADLDNAYIVEETDDEDDTVKIKGQEEYLDIQDDDYTFGSTKVKLSKQNFYELKVKNDKKDGWMFISGTELSREDVVLDENDRIIVEPTQKLFIIIKGYK